MREYLCRLTTALMISSILLMAGCGGGGATDKPTPTGTVVSMVTMKGLLSGGLQGYLNFPNVAGSDQQGHTLSGNLLVQGDGWVYEDGQMFRMVQSFLTLQVGNSPPDSAMNTAYFRNDGSYYKVIDDNSGVTYSPNSQFLLPNTMSVGDSGPIATFTGGDGSTITMTWALAPGVNGGSILAITSVTRIGESIDLTEVDSYLLDPNGAPTGISIRAVTGGNTITLTGQGAQLNIVQ